MSAQSQFHSQYKNSHSSPAISAHQNKPAPASAKSPPAAPAHPDPSSFLVVPNSPAAPQNSPPPDPPPQSSPRSSHSQTESGRPHARACRPPQSHSPAKAHSSRPNISETLPHNLPS